MGCGINWQETAKSKEGQAVPCKRGEGQGKVIAPYPGRSVLKETEVSRGHSKVNEEKSAVGLATQRKFLGFSFY